jgi:hypothetical protein
LHTGHTKRTARESNERMVKKHLSTSPRKAAKKAPKSAQGRKKAYMIDSSVNTKLNSSQVKGLYNMKDLNSFIKTIEKDLTDKQAKNMLKDFNSMPTTPTSIVKQYLNGFSNTCPNIAQILSSLDD